MGLQSILKVLVGMLLVVRPQYRNWQSLMCNEVLNGGGGLDVYSGGGGG